MRWQQDEGSLGCEVEGGHWSTRLTLKSRVVMWRCICGSGSVASLAANAARLMIQADAINTIQKPQYALG